MQYATNKILFVINAGLGDVCHAMPILFALYEKHSLVKLELLFASKSAKELTSLFFPQVTGVVTSEMSTFIRKLLQINKWRRARFDYVISGAHLNSRKTALISCAVRAKQSIGMRRERFSFLYDIVAARSNGNNIYADFAALFKQVGISDLEIEFGKKRFSREIKKIAQFRGHMLIPDKSSFVTIAFANGADNIIRGKWRPSLKRIPNSILLNIFKRLKQNISTRFLLLGVDEDTFPDEMKYDSGVIDLRGRTRVVDLISILAATDVLICNDTGTMHLAHFCDTPFIALFGPTDAKKFAPAGLHENIIQAYGVCAPCQPEPICSSKQCELLNQVDADRIVSLATDILNRKYYHKQY